MRHGRASAERGCCMFWRASACGASACACACLVATFNQHQRLADINVPAALPRQPGENKARTACETFADPFPLRVRDGGRRTEHRRPACARRNNRTTQEKGGRENTSQHVYLPSKLQWQNNPSSFLHWQIAASAKTHSILALCIGKNTSSLLLLPFYTAKHDLYPSTFSK